MGKLRIYLDNCCFNRPYDDQTQERIYLEALAKMHIQQMIIDEKIEFVWSYVLEYENSRNPYSLRKTPIRDFSYLCAEFIDKSKEKEIIKLAYKIKEAGIKEKDSLHIACAIYSDCDYFITTDDRLFSYQTSKIKIQEPIQFIRETEEKL